MTSSRTTETVTGTQPIAPVATMSTINFKPVNSHNSPLDDYVTVSQDNTESSFTEQDKSTAATIDLNLPFNSSQPMGSLPENKSPSPPKEALDAAKVMVEPELTSLPEKATFSQPEASPVHISEANCLYSTGINIEKQPLEKALIDSDPEVNKHISEESTDQPIQDRSQPLPNDTLDLPYLIDDRQNVLEGADQVQTRSLLPDLGLTFHNHPPSASASASHYPEYIDNNIAPNQALDNPQQVWVPQWDEDQANTEGAGVQLDGYAKLVFDDSEFYMTTHELIIGRDMAAYNNMITYLREQAQIEKAWASERDFTFRQTVKIEKRSAGIVDPWVSLQPERRNRKRREINFTPSAVATTYASSYPLPLVNGNIPMQNPDPYSCPVVRVHPPFDKGLAGFKAISREHIKIFYDHEQDIFKVEFLGRNGGFVDGKFYDPKQMAPLTSGSKLQLGFVYFKFILPDVVIDDTGFQYHEELEEEVATATATYSEGGKEMSLSFDDAPRAGDQRSTDNSELDSNDGYSFGLFDNDEDDGVDPSELSIVDYAEIVDYSDNMLQTGEQNDEEQDIEEEESLVDNPNDASPQPAKKRGPGRPPKNGVMSKREQGIAKREALERERIQEERAQEEQRAENQNQATASKTVPGKNKVGRPRKHPRPDVTEEGPPRQKRKYTKRQSGPKSPEDADEDKFDDDGNCTHTKSGSSRKVAYVLKPVSHKREECTTDQLTRPPMNYQQVIFDILKVAGQPLCLPQIYNEMEVKYPYYAFQESKGWQSSVRHNLGQHECFERTKRAGKGWAWCIKAGASYLKEKKKKAPSPPISGGNQPIYQAGHPVPGYGANQMQPPHGYVLNHHWNPHPQGEYQQYQQGQPYMGPPNPHYTSYPAQGYAPPQGIQPSFIPPMAPQLAPTAPASYSSPYAPKPPTATIQSQGTQQPQQQQPQQQQSQQQQPQQQYSQQSQYPPQGVQQPPNTSQSQVLPQQQQSSAGNQIQTQPQAAPQVAPQVTLAPIHQKRVIPPNLIAAVTGYRNHVVNLMRQRAPQNDAEALVDKAINRVYDGTEEDRSLDSTEHEMKLINGVLNVLKLPLVPRTATANTNHTQQQQSAPQQPSQPLANQNKPQGNTSQQPGKATGSDLPKQTIMRPSFYGNNQNQSNGSFVPRPPLMTPGLQRTNSGSAQNAPSRPNTASSSSAVTNPSNPPQQAAASNNKTGGATPPVANIDNQTITQVVDKNGTNHGLKAGETLTEAGFVRSFPQPQVST